MAEATLNKSGDILFLDCDCGARHKIKFIPELKDKDDVIIPEHLEIESSFKKSFDNKPVKKSIFNREGR